MKNCVIASTGSYLPERIVYNEDFTQFPPTSSKRIAEKTGVLARRIASPDQCTSDLAVKAARACLDRIGFPPEEIQGIILSTSSPDRIQPATATRVQHFLGASDKSFAFDINSVCSGSVVGIALAHSMISSGQCENILFIASEMYSRILDKNDFRTFPYFGDGAGAILFQAGNSSRGVLHSCLRTDGSKCEVVGVPAGGTMMPLEKVTDPREATLRMNGRAIFDFALSRGPEIIIDLCRESGVKIEEIDHFICHQANVNIIKKIMDTTGAGEEKFYINLFHYGNTASASVLIALDEALTKGIVKEGDLIAAVAFGGGLSWGASLIRV